ncbi:unnamed protein product [Phyllotreta striolata]|uniref:Glycoside hydrolase family 79 n=1 Tax=Phyllotreta striolata TaxID=444603 RepID=A0A9P0GW18_PHYSR|nr:unnamed protein product [Phyllotreta striolata]
MTLKWNEKLDRSNRKHYLVLFLLLFLLIFTLAFELVGVYNQNQTSSVQIIYVESDKPAVFKTDPRFLSLGLDAIVIANGFRRFNMSDPRLIKMIKYLGPGYLRIGGNLQERIKFSLLNDTNEYLQDDNIALDLVPNITLTASNWLKLNKLASSANMEIFYGLNALQRFPNGSWDPRNAEIMIKYTTDHGFKVNWELGNEPNSFRHKFNEAVNATQMSKDFVVLRSILNKYSKYNRSMLVGPDTTRPQRNPESQIYLEQFIKRGSFEVDKITWHQYYVNGHNTSAEEFLDPKIYDLLKFQIDRVKEITNKTHRAIWLGETSSAYGGGAPELSDRFTSVFMWLDKLGLAAKLGVELVMRQSIFHGNYSLLDDFYNPNPDWWVSLIYKRYVGQVVVPIYNVTTDRVRLYAHCSKNIVQKGITIFGFNVDHSPANVELQGLRNLDGRVPPYVEEFLLQTNYLTSKNVFCNGRLLAMLPGNQLPNIFGVIKNISPYLTLPPFSVVFWNIPNVRVKACM